MEMDTMTEIEVRGLERRAALREQHADEIEAENAFYRRRSPQQITLSQASANRYRAEAHELREKAERLRRQNP